MKRSFLSQILFSFSSNKDRSAVFFFLLIRLSISSSIFVGAEREENLIRNDTDKSEFTIFSEVFR